MLANDGKADKLIMATDLLGARIRDIQCARRRAGFADLAPTIADLEKTHILFINAHYRPYAALGYEYVQVNTGGGNAGWGNPVQFSIPAYGEFFSDMVVNVSLGAVSCSAGVVPGFPSAIFADATSSGPTAPTISTVTTATKRVTTVVAGDNSSTTVYTQEYVNHAGEVIATGSPATNYVRYCEYPGEILFKEVNFRVNGNPLDSYGREVPMFYRKFWLSADKEAGWCRLVGQEVPVEGFSDFTSIAGESPFSAPIKNLNDVTGALAAGAPALATITSRQKVQIVNGPQTPKAVQPALEMWIPLLFWFNKDIRLAIPSISIPAGQRFIDITMENQNNVVFPAPGDLLLRLTTEVRTHALVSGSYSTRDVVNVSRQVSCEPVLLSDSVVSSNQKVAMTMYVNNIFVNPEIHDIYIKRIGFSLIRVSRIQKQSANASNASVLMSSLKWPTEFIYFALVPTWNNDVKNPNRYRDWHNLTYMTDEVLSNVATSSGAVKVDTTAEWGAGGSQVCTFDSRVVSNQITVPVSTPTLNSIKITIQGNNVINTIATPFFRDYIPWYHSRGSLCTPKDLGAMFINFAIHPGDYQPSGHINISRAREFYVEYISSYCNGSSDTNCDLIALASAINFLLISDGSALLRFTS